MYVLPFSLCKSDDNEDGDFNVSVGRHTPQAYRVVSTAGAMPLDESVASPNRSKLVSASFALKALFLQDLPVQAQDSMFRVIPVSDPMINGTYFPTNKGQLRCV
jgi:hypothetical protein